MGHGAQKWGGLPFPMNGVSSTLAGSFSMGVMLTQIDQPIPVESGGCSLPVVWIPPDFTHISQGPAPPAFRIRRPQAGRGPAAKDVPAAGVSGGADCDCATATATSVQPPKRVAGCSFLVARKSKAGGKPHKRLVFVFFEGTLEIGSTR